MATQTQTTINDLPGWQKPYVQYGFGQMQNWYNKNQPKYYPKSGVAGFSPMQKGAFAAAGGAGKQNAQLAASGSKYLQDVVGGKYAGDPYGSAVFKDIQSKVLPSVNSQFSSAGRYGSGAHAGTETTALTNAFAPHAVQMNENNQQRRMGAAGMMPQFGNMSWNNAFNQYGMGQNQQQFGQAQIDDAMQRWNFQQQLPYNKISDYMKGISGQYGGSTIQTSPKPGGGGGGWGNILGAGLSLLGLGS